MRILVAEKIADSGLDDLRAAGYEVDIQEGLSNDELCKAIKGAHGLIIRSATTVTKEVISHADSLIAIGRAGIGVDNIDIDAATQAGVMVINAPQSNIISAAEHAIALMMSLARHIPNAHRDLMGGAWNRSKYEGTEIAGKNIGIVGLGRVGTLVAQRLSGFEANLIGYDPFVSAERAAELGVTLYEKLDEFVAACDIMTVHLPKIKETVDIINGEILKNAQPHMLLINTARGGIVNQDDLYVALRDGTIAGAGLDVFVEEPTTESPLFELENVVVTPHLGASTSEAQDKAGLTIAEQMALALSGNFVPFALNLDAKAATTTVAPYIAVADAIGRVAAALAGSTIVEMKVYAQGKISESDCSILTLSALAGMMKGTSDEPVSLVNAPALAAARGIKISDARESDGKGYSSRLKISVTTSEGQNVLVYGTITGKSKTVRICRINQNEMDVVKSPHLLIISNDDRPGMVGAVGTILGGAKININGMDVGQGAVDGKALMVVSTTEQVPENVVAELDATDGIYYAHTVELD